MKEYLKVLDTGKKVITIDESWLEYSDGTTMVWSKKNQPNSVPSLLIQPRISIIVALSTEGEVYISIAQHNNNSSMMGMFIRHLVNKLNKERKNWRENTIWIWDG